MKGKNTGHTSRHEAAAALNTPSFISSTSTYNHVHAPSCSDLIEATQSHLNRKRATRDRDRRAVVEILGEQVSLSPMQTQTTRQHQHHQREGRFNGQVVAREKGDRGKKVRIGTSSTCTVRQRICYCRQLFARQRLWPGGLSYLALAALALSLLRTRFHRVKSSYSFRKLKHAPVR